MEHTIKLLTGYTDPKGLVHRDVTFGKRLTVADIITLDNDPTAQMPTQYRLTTLRRMITKFGDLSVPPSLQVMVSLDTIDLEDLASGADRFLDLERGDRKWEVLDDDGTIRLAYGFEIGGSIFNVVRFGRIPTGADEVEADRLGFGNGVAREAFLVGRQITRIETDDGLSSHEGPIELDQIKTVDGSDFNWLRTGAQIAKALFRSKREAVLGERNGESGPAADARNGHDGVGDPEAADGADRNISERSEGTGA